MTTIDSSKIFISGTFDDATVKVAANTTLKAGTVLGLKSNGDLTAFSTDNNVSEVAGEKANGELVFTGTAGTSVPIGTKVKTAGDVVFETLETGAIATGATTVTIPARAAVTGVSGNIAASTTLSLVTSISGISGVANSTKFAGGVDAVNEYKTEPTYILANDIVNSTSSAAEYELSRVFVEGEINKSKVVFAKTADASNVNVLATLKNNGFILRTVQEVCES